MILVVLGTQKFQLNRLLLQIDTLIEKGILNEKVFAQTGNSDYKPAHYKYKDFLPKEQFEQMIQNCDVLITHGGVGTIISGLKYGKPIIVFPRLEKYKEHVDNHQNEIAESFSASNYVLHCKEDDNLEKLLKKCRTHKFSRYISQQKTIIGIINHYLDSI